jgi:mannose-6-phosphate isomerase-like protein (cupin superfamily)|tara:strand:- start:1029 stop:1358 length:330 start_codon:yes stop_codon:yes gene_type:complete
MRLNINDIGGNIAKEDDRYIVKDNTTLKNLVVSSTRLKQRKATTGHKHEGQEEVYYFVEGTGKMELDDDTIKVQPGDVVLIEDGVFHRVHAGMHEDLYFVCVFDGRRSQ